MRRFGVIVSYDCKSNKTRKKIIDACFDYGLDRIQYSVFAGTLKPPQYKELANRLKLMMNHKNPMSIFIQKVPIGSISDFLLYEYDEGSVHHFNTYEKRRGFFD
jgi:CRISPR-associated protein Cas2